jgi:hypothetical protein
VATLFIGLGVPLEVAFPPSLLPTVSPSQTLSIPDFGYVFEGLPVVDQHLGEDPEDLGWSWEGEPFPGQQPVVEGIAGVGTILGPLAAFVRPEAPWVFVSDEGGQIVDFRPSGVIGRGPFTVRLRDAADDLWPNDRPGCWSAEPGRGFEIWAGRDNRRIRFTLPPLPLGVYDLLVTDAADSIVIEVPAFFRVLRRQRPWPIGYGFIRSFPLTWPLGNRHPQLEELAADENRPPYNGWQAVGKALGWIAQRYGAPACTRLREDYSPGDLWLLVETTLGFDAPLEVRAVWIDGLRVPIFEVDHDGGRFALTSPDPVLNQRSAPPGRPLPGMIPVVVDESSCPHPNIFAEPDLGDTAVEAGPLFAYRDSFETTPTLFVTGDAITFGTVAFWHRQGSIGVNGHFVIATFEPPLIGGSPGPFTVSHVPSGSGFRVRLTAGGLTATSTAVFEQFASRGTGSWRSYVVTYGGGNVRLFVDGVEVCAVPGAGPFVCAFRVLGGSDISSGGVPIVPQKRVTNIAAWTEAFSDGAVAMFHAAGFDANPAALPTPVPAAPVGLWRGDIEDSFITNIGSLAPANDIGVGPGVTAEEIA